MTPALPRFDLVRPTSPAYATLPIEAAFTWASSAATAPEGEWYLVCFRSIRSPRADEVVLTTLDDAAYADASSAPGFLHYFKGPVSARGECLSFCIWESRRAARAATGHPAHVAAASIVHETYTTYALELHRLVKRRGRTSFDFEPWPTSPAAAAPVGASPPASLPVSAPASS